MARGAMRDGARGTVRAVFAHSFYIVLDEQWICIGPQTLGQGPLNALWSGSGAFQLPIGGAPVRIARHMLMVGGRTFAHIPLGPQPLPTVPRPWTASNLSHGLGLAITSPRRWPQRRDYLPSSPSLWPPRATRLS
jgi:hypothetical protein